VAIELSTLTLAVSSERNEWRCDHVGLQVRSLVFRNTWFRLANEITRSDLYHATGNFNRSGLVANYSRVNELITVKLSRIISI
jgi:hypothetical protein